MKPSYSFKTRSQWRVLAVFVLVINSTVFGQNLVLNPSFESVNTGALQCSWYTTVGQFNNAINNWTLPTGGSTDIFNTALATTCYCSPFSTHASNPGQQAPRTGNGYSNIVTYGNGGCSPWREYLQGQLSSPLVVGTTYEVEMWVSLADKMSVGTNNIGVKFSTNPYTQGGSCGYYTTPDLNYTGPIILDKQNWVQIIFCYTPTTAGLDNFIIGNFYNDAATATAAASGNTSGNTIRYFVDDVRIEEISSVGGNPGTNGSLSVCSSSPSVNLFNSLGGTPDITGTWSGPSTLSGGHLGTFNPSTNVAGTYTYSVASSVAPCAVGGGSNSATVTVTLTPNNDATITPVGPFCTSDPTFTLSAVDPGGTWSGTGITNASAGTFNPATAGAGSHTITYSIPGSCGDVQTTTITINSFSNASITPAGPFCLSDGAQNLSAVDPGGSWSGTGITNASAGTFSPSVAGIGTHTITYTIPGTCGDVQSTTITVNPTQDASITPVGSLCELDTPITLTAVDGGGTWSGAGITDPANGVFDPVTAGSGTHTVTYTIAGACGDVQTSNITVIPSYDATITPVGPFCEMDAGIQLTAASLGGTWSGLGITDPTNGNFSPAVAGTGSHTITYAIAGMCGDTQSTTITVNPLDDPTIAPVGPLCMGTPSITLTPATTPGTWSGTGITDPTNGVFDPVTAGSGTHTITYLTNDVCPNVGITTIDVLNALSVIALQNATICEGESSSLSASANGGNGTYTYVWTDQNGTVVGSGTNITVSPSVTTTYTVTVDDGCTIPSASDDVTITVNPIPTIAFTVDNPISCAPLDVIFTNNSSPQGTNCLWDFGDGTTSATCGTVSHTYTNIGCYDVSLTVTETGCTNALTQNSMVCVVDDPVADFSFNPQTVDLFDPQIFFENTSLNATSYAWDFGDGTGSSVENPSHTFPFDAGEYTICLTVSNDYNCTSEICKPLIVQDGLTFYIPNTFTPDGDQHNQTFKPVFTAGFDPQDFNLLIFNRWGEVIWESYDASVGWDGTYGGEPVQDGTYVWKVEFKVLENDERMIRTGHVNVMR